ncbi:MAG TPA: hypothetical protein VJR06_01170 [Nitrososphaerales archaeon]|nr:hypothetical protein [Nitrososphaerales archaeon]
MSVGPFIFVGGGPPQTWSNLKGKPFIIVSVNGGPGGDGGDYGSNTPGTTTNGFAEAVAAASTVPGSVVAALPGTYVLTSNVDVETSNFTFLFDANVTIDIQSTIGSPGLFRFGATSSITDVSMVALGTVTFKSSNSSTAYSFVSVGNAGGFSVKRFSMRGIWTNIANASAGVLTFKQAFLLLAGITDFYIEGIKAYGNTAPAHSVGNAQNGIYLVSGIVDKGTIADCYFEDCGNSGGATNTNSSPAFSMLSSATFTNCTLRRISSKTTTLDTSPTIETGAAGATTPATGITVIDCDVECYSSAAWTGQNWGNAIGFGGALDCTAINCTAHNCFQGAFDIANASRCSFINCVSYDGYLFGFHIGDSPSDGNSQFNSLYNCWAIDSNQKSGANNPGVLVDQGAQFTTIFGGGAIDDQSGAHTQQHGIGISNNTNVQYLYVNGFVASGNVSGGTDWTTSTSGTNIMFKNCPGITPFSGFSPSTPATGVAFPLLAYDAIYVMTQKAGVSGITLDGQALLTTADVPIPVGANHSLATTWATSAPVFQVLPQN